MEYKYNKNNLNPDLVSYIEENIFPEYDLNEIGHGINHILDVINHSFNIAQNYDVNLNIVYAVAAYHDIGHHIDRKKHEVISAEMMIKDSNLSNFFSKDDLNTIKIAIEDHRASNDSEPRNLYGRIISAADKNLTVKKAICRTFTYTKEHNPEFTFNDVLEEIYNHLNNKFGKNGYAKVYIKDEYFENFKSEIISLLENKNKFLEFVMQTLKEEKYI